MSNRLPILKHMIRKRLERKGLDPEAVDLDALIDPKLSYYENLKNLEDKLGVKLLDEGEYTEDDIQRMVEEGNEEILRQHLEENGIDEGVIAELEKKEMEHISEMHEKFKELVKKGDVLETLSKLLFPELYGKDYDVIRKAVLLSLVTHYDKGKRRRLHVLIHGPAGTGKSEVLRWLHRKFGYPLVNGEHASKAGFVGDARGKEIKPGLLADYDGMVICIDELDKMSPKDQSGLLQAMEEGSYSIIKGGHRKRFRAEVRVIATANDIKKLTSPLLDRFDFVIEVKIPNKEERKKMIDHLVDAFFGVGINDDAKILHEYLEWISDFEPQVKDLDTIKKVMRAYLELTNADLENKSIRSFEYSILRVSYALAKLQRDDLKPYYVVKAISLKDPELTDTQYHYLMSLALGKL